MAAGELSLFLHRVRDFVTRPPVVCTPQTTVAEVARLLSIRGVGSAIVSAADGASLGIVTDRDLRRKVVAEGRDARSTRVVDIMSAPVVGIAPGALAFEAILEMTRRQIRHLAVVEDGRLVGVVSLHDFLVSQTVHPVMLAREIARAPSLDSLAVHGTQIADLAGRLVGEGGSAHDISRLVSELNDRVVARVLVLAAEHLADSGEAAPPVAYCWLSFGSEARREQTLRTDQDNGLVFADAAGDLQESAARSCLRLAEEAVSGLVRVGVPRCPGGIMASNPRWCQPLSVWRDYFRRWISDPTTDQVLAASIHFDLRPLAGANELGQSLAEAVREAAPQHHGFLRLLASDVVDRRVPLTLLGRIATPRTGPHRGAVDLKGAGAMQLVGAGRVHALELGVGETSTIDRFRAALDRGLYSPDVGREIIDAAQHLMRLRMVHQLEQRARGEALDNAVALAGLSHADRILLREALRTVTHVQATLRQRFATDFAPRAGALAVRLTRLDQKLAAGIVGLFLLPAALAAGALVALYRWGAFGDPFIFLITVVVGLAALMGYLGLIAHTVGQSLVRAVRQLQLGTELIATVNPAHRLEIDTGDELQRLAEEINRLADRLAAATQDGAEAAAGVAAAAEAERVRLAGVLDALGDGVLVTTPAGRVSLANRAARTLAGEALLGRELADIVADPTAVREAADRFGAGARGAARCALRARDGGMLDGVVTPLLDGDGRLTGLAILLRGRAGEGPVAGEAGRMARFRGAGFTSGAGAAATVAPGPEFYDFSILEDLERRLESADRLRPLGRLTCTVLDVETTGLDPSRGDRIVSIACVRIRDGVVRAGETLDALVNPGRGIPPATSLIHGITDDMVASSPPIEVVLPEVLRFARDTVLVGHHVGFDLRFLDQATHRIGCPPLARSHTVLDTRLLSKALHDPLGPHDLESVCARLGIVPLGRHSALGDALATAEVMVRLVELLQKRGILTLGEALSMMARVREWMPSSEA